MGSQQNFLPQSAQSPSCNDGSASSQYTEWDQCHSHLGSYLGRVGKNLIGSTTSNATGLSDLNGAFGIWVAFPDLSVRTEGWFRLRMKLLALFEFIFEADCRILDQSIGLLKEAPCLASVFSEPFKVFKPREFPGMLKNTELSRHFAKQGITMARHQDNCRK